MSDVDSPTEFRDENFRLMDSLFYLAGEHGLGVAALYTHGDFFIEYFKASNGKEPQLEWCRDEQDYKLRFEAWFRLCTVRSPHYGSFHGMVQGEINRLKEMPL